MLRLCDVEIRYPRPPRLPPLRPRLPRAKPGGRAAAAPLEEIAAKPRKGRGAISNPTGRFEPNQRVEVADGWDEAREEPSLVTHVTLERPKTVITRNDSPDLSFDRSINPTGAASTAASIVLRGRPCLHGAVARP